MSILKLENMVPEIYANESRDFQLILRMYDYIINGVKFNADQVANVSDTDLCSSNLLSLLQSRIGFFSSANITDDDMRYILKAFPYIIKNKGSLRAVKQAVNVFCKINKVTTKYDILYKNKSTADDNYTIVIRIQHSFLDTTILDEIFKYILPPAYVVKYDYQSEASADESKFVLKDTTDSLLVDSYDNMKIVQNTDNVVDTDHQDTFTNRVGLVITENKESEYTYEKVDTPIIELEDNGSSYTVKWNSIDNASGYAVYDNGALIGTIQDENGGNNE